MEDEVIREVWRTKDTLAARFDYDIRRLVEHLRAEEKAAQCVVVDLRDRQQARAAPGA